MINRCRIQTNVAIGVRKRKRSEYVPCLSSVPVPFCTHSQTVSHSLQGEVSLSHTQTRTHTLSLSFSRSLYLSSSLFPLTLTHSISPSFSQLSHSLVSISLSLSLSHSLSLCFLSLSLIHSLSLVSISLYSSLSLSLSLTHTHTHTQSLFVVTNVSGVRGCALIGRDQISAAQQRLLRSFNSPLLHFQETKQCDQIQFKDTERLFNTINVLINYNVIKRITMLF